MATTDAGIVLAIQALTSYSVQTSAEATAGTNTTANILYSTAAKKQGCYTVFKAIAADQVVVDLARQGKSASDAWQEKAIAYLIADLQKKKDPTWAAKSESYDSISISWAGDGQTGYMKAYKAMLETLALTDSDAFGDQDDDGIVQTKDCEDYPSCWKLSGLEDDDVDPF
jgi:hypothetical protein